MTIYILVAEKLTVNRLPLKRSGYTAFVDYGFEILVFFPFPRQLNVVVTDSRYASWLGSTAVENTCAGVMLYAALGLLDEKRAYAT